MSRPTIPVLVATDDRGETILLAPKVGVWSGRPQDGALIEPGSPVGTLTQLGRRYLLLAPAGVSGRVASTGRSPVAVPLGYGDALFRLMAITGLSAGVAAGGAATPRGAKPALHVTAPTDGVFYRSPAVDARPYVVAGDRVTLGQPIGLIEVMKTFNPIAYGGADLPDGAEIVEVLVADGAEVRAGQPLVVVKRP